MTTETMPFNQKPSNKMKGLSSVEVKCRQQQYGKNELSNEKGETFFKKALHIIKEPMFLLLLISAVIYFILGEARDGAVMLIFVIGMISIDIIQEWKTDKTLRALKDLSAPHVTVLRDGVELEIASVDLVPGDLMMICEGDKIPADGKVLRCNDLCVDESSLTGESEGVWKTAFDKNTEDSEYFRKDHCFAGTLVTQGTALIEVEKIGSKTEYGKIGAGVAAAPKNPTPLQKQTGELVKLCAGIAALLFVLVSIITYLNVPADAVSDRMIGSVLSGITLAMAMIPEEFPVVLTVFLSMGAWRLAKKQSLVRKLPAVETLGEISVLCVDKTGTITKNQMTVEQTAAISADQETLVEIMGLACETDTYDPMEKAMLSYCEKNGFSREHLFAGDLLNEYAFTHETKRMGHIWKHDGELLIAAKGSFESILPLCDLTDDRKMEAVEQSEKMSYEGLRVIAVGVMKPKSAGEIPKRLEDCTLMLCGLVGLADPPRETIKDDIKRCTKAGIRVVMITGDNGITAESIAKKVGIPNSDQIITGDELESMTDKELQKRIQHVSVFSRVIPEHKMRIVKAFQEIGEIVAMTGDGVNDAPALKYADIGVAMGKRGSEVSREAADLILLDDRFSTIVDTVKDGRRIYDNIKKAVGYIFTIHIPIALACLFAPLLHIPSEGLLLLPLHVVLLELIIDPTCSIVLERQPPERNIMTRKPRRSTEQLVTGGLLFRSVLQGLVIFLASFGAYLLILFQGDSAELARTMGLSILFLSNLFLVWVVGSQNDFAITLLKTLRRDKVMWAASAGTILGLLLMMYTPIHTFLKLAPLSSGQLSAVVLLSAIAVFWYEFVKLFRKIQESKKGT